MDARLAIRVVLIVTALVGTAGCRHSDQPYQFMLADFLAVKELPYDSPPQVIYRIDDHRYVTLERYRDCYHGDSWYNDTRAGIRRLLSRGGIEDYQGKLINADPTGRNLVFPSGAPPHMASIDRGWSVELMYSTDGGKTFHALEYMPHSFDPFEDSRNYIVAATEDKLYVAEKSSGDAYVLQYPLLNGIDLSRPYPHGVTGDSFALSSRPELLSRLKSQFEDDQIHCDNSIKPTNPDAPLTRSP